MRINSFSWLALLLAPLLVLPLTATAWAGSLTVAFSNSFILAADQLIKTFETDTGNNVVGLGAGSGIIYVKISMGERYDVFLAGDSETPKKAIAAGFGVPGTEFTYALGKIVMFSADPKLVKGAETLKAGAFQKLAVADPKTGPYGTAPLEVMKKFGVYDALAPKLDTVDSISQAYLSASGMNGEAAFVALSQVADRKDGSRWLVPQEDYTPITMDAVLLTSGKDNQAAKDFLDFLKSDKAVKIIHSYGFGTAN